VGSRTSAAALRSFLLALGRGVALVLVTFALLGAAPAAQPNPDVTFHKAPKPLPPGAITSDWPHFLGPTFDYRSPETKLAPKFGEKGPPLVWEMNKGSGYAAPVIVRDRLILFHRVGDEERVECLHPETGQRYWSYGCPTVYRDDYGYSDGPRASPVIAGDAVVARGAEDRLHCLDLATGTVRWSHDLFAEFRLKKNFFGVGSTPLVEGDKVIVNVGGKDACVVAFDLATGKVVWKAGSEWGPSYASPIPATVHGKRRVFVFAGGKSDPPTGGLMCIDPASGAVDFTFPWRGDRVESVNAASPLVLDGTRVLVSETYGAGSAMLDLLPDGKSKPLWTNPAFGMHFMTPVRRDKHLYGVDGHGPNDAFLVCVEADTGKEVWRTQPEWEQTIEGRTGPRRLRMGTYRAWFMPVDERFLCLGEFGHLLWADLTPQGYKELDRAQLFLAGETWTPPALSRGLLYVCQNSPAAEGKLTRAPRLLCYDLRAP
jgi:outer membrane protein assembly factor BamB